MIMENEDNVEAEKVDAEGTRQQRRKMARMMTKAGLPDSQTILNNVLWKIIMENKGFLKVPSKDIIDAPQNAALNIGYDEATDSVIIVAGTNDPKEPKIIGLNKEIFTG